MQLYLLFLAIGFFVFLFSLYKLGKDDIVFIRRNVSLEQLFNIAFLLAFVGLLSARIFYVAEHPARGFLNPLVFFLFPYFPGLSLIGGVFGAALVLLYYSTSRKLPIGRIFDFFAIALFCSLPFGLIGSIFLTGKITLLESLFLPILYLLLLIVILTFFFPRLMQNNLQQGSIGALGIVLFSLVSFLTSMVQDKHGIIWFIGVQEIIAIILFVAALSFLIRQEA